MGTLVENINYKVIDNFIEKDKFLNLKNTLISEDLPWFFRKNMTQNDNWFFAHCFYKYGCPQSNCFVEFISPILTKLKCKAIIEVRANLMLKKETCYNSTFHTDHDFNCFTAILYINTNNGFTILDEKEKIKIESVENRMLIFDSKIKHSAFSQTDAERRIVINFNYF
jgi:hypothetical protein